VTLKNHSIYWRSHQIRLLSAHTNYVTQLQPFKYPFSCRVTKNRGRGTQQKPHEVDLSLLLHIQEHSAVMSLMAAFRSPRDTSLANDLAICPSSCLWHLRWFRQLWIERHSCKRESMSPFCHLAILSTRHRVWSLGFDLRCGL